MECSLAERRISIAYERLRSLAALRFAQDDIGVYKVVLRFGL
jgi:hypothetical protein